MTTHSRNAREAKRPQMTEYAKQLVEFHDFPHREGWLVTFASWLLLAGFVTFPATFTNLKQANLSGQPFGTAGQWLISKIQNLPLLGVACGCSGLGALGLFLFWIRWRHNYFIVSEKVFLPAVQQGSAGVINTVINVYTAQDKTWSITARVSVCVEGGVCVICILLFALNRLLIKRIKKIHYKEMKAHQNANKQQPRQRGQFDEEKHTERRQSRMSSNGEQRLFKERKAPSRHSTARSMSERTMYTDQSPVDSRRFSELRVVDPLVYGEGPYVIPNPRRPTIDHTPTRATIHVEHPYVTPIQRRPTIDHTLTGATVYEEPRPYVIPIQRRPTIGPHAFTTEVGHTFATEVAHPLTTGEVGSTSTTEVGPTLNIEVDYTLTGAPEVNQTPMAEVEGQTECQDDQCQDDQCQDDQCQDDQCQDDQDDDDVSI